VDLKDRDENQVKLRRRVEMKEVKVLNPPRAGKKCLVRLRHRTVGENNGCPSDTKSRKKLLTLLGYRFTLTATLITVG